MAFGVYLKLVTHDGPLVQTVALPPRFFTSRLPLKEISERTSYLQVRLEFHRYPHLIPAIFNLTRVRSSSALYRTFNLDMGRSPGFGSTTTYFLRPFKTRFRYGSVFFHLNLACNRNSPVHSARGTPSPINGLRQLVGTWFQELFHSPSGVLFTFPSRYWFTIGH